MMGQRGMTLVEVLVGLAFIGMALLPLSLFQARVGDTAKVHDLYMAQALLQGEVNLLYRNGRLPAPSRSVPIGARTYTIVFTHSVDRELVTWTMHVEKAGRVIREIQGLSFAAGREEVSR